ncbi:probable metal-nicotianamine transporter YSL8 isoform X1 [Camellia sinensis]|uniref:probable metal-nicotianamine transporter YSL8 isoform X1 n=1 Tax=Camellia sinensis TaxID=4442 RepID=UPI0010367D2C|nr:probable metal-nicotianamine transporter YSL8 isoform X1 [Camellia sinensis]
MVANCVLSEQAHGAAAGKSGETEVKPLQTISTQITDHDFRGTELSDINEKPLEDQAVPEDQPARPKTEMKNQENLGSEVNPSGDSWSDSCLEFAFKTLTGALAVKGYCNFLPEEKLLQAVKVGQVVYLSGTASYLLGMSGRIAAQADEASNPINVKNLSLGWMIGFLFLVSFVGLFSIAPLRKMMILKYKLTYPSGTATAYLINSFHTPKGAKLAKKQVMMLFYSLCGSFTNALFQWFFTAADGCGFSNFPTFGLKAFSQRLALSQLFLIIILLFYYLLLV